MPCATLSSSLMTGGNPWGRAAVWAVVFMGGIVLELQSSVFRRFMPNHREMDTPRPRPAAPAGVPESPVLGDLTRAVTTRSTTYDSGHHIQPHWHSRAQFVYAVAGTMRVR